MATKITNSSRQVHWYPKDRKTWNLCDAKSLGDEFHYIFRCTALKKVRTTYINEKFLKHPNTLNMEILLTNKDPMSLSKLATFCSIVMASMMEGKKCAKPKLKRRRQNNA